MNYFWHVRRIDFFYHLYKVYEYYILKIINKKIINKSITFNYFSLTLEQQSSVALYRDKLVELQRYPNQFDVIFFFALWHFSLTWINNNSKPFIFFLFFFLTKPIPLGFQIRCSICEKRMTRLLWILERITFRI